MYIGIVITKGGTEKPVTSRSVFKFKDMKKLALESMEGVRELTKEEAVQITGGDGVPNFWYDFGYVVGTAIKGLIVFGEEGGRNAGLCVK